MLLPSNYRQIARPYQCIIFFYDFFPVMVQVKKERTSILEFLVSLAAPRWSRGCVRRNGIMWIGACFPTTAVLAGRERIKEALSRDACGDERILGCLVSRGDDGDMRGSG